MDEARWRQQWQHVVIITDLWQQNETHSTQNWWKQLIAFSRSRSLFNIFCSAALYLQGLVWLRLSIPVSQKQAEKSLGRIIVAAALCCSFENSSCKSCLVELTVTAEVAGSLGPGVHCESLLIFKKCCSYLILDYANDWKMISKSKETECMCGIFHFITSTNT